MICLMPSVAMLAVRAAVKPSCPAAATQQSFSSQLTKNEDNTEVALASSNS